MQNKKLLFSILLLAILIMPLFANAVTAVSIVQSIASTLKNVVLILAVAGWIVTAILFFLGTGNPNMVGLAKKAAIASILGTVVYALSEVALGIIRSALFSGQ